MQSASTKMWMPKKQPEIRATTPRQWIHSRIGYVTFLLILVIMLFLCALIAVSIGIAGGSVWELMRAIRCLDVSTSLSQIMLEMRLPRVIAACITGASFALSGTIMQGITRNPLADAGLLGINAGACFSVTLCTVFLPTLSYNRLIGVAFLGAAVAALMVFGYGTKQRNANPIRLILAGAAVSAFLTALSQAISLVCGLSKDLSFYTAGSLSGILWAQVKTVVPWLLMAGIIGLFLAPKLSILALGDESATGLGVHVGVVRIFGLFMVLLLAGCSVSLVGGISFVGIIIPHMARKLVGVDYRRIAPAATLMGAVLLVLSDVVARILQAPFDTPTGALVSMIGVPVFLLLTYQNGRSKL